MRAIVEALITATDFINFRTEEMTQADDIAALEAIALQLSKLSDQEFREFALIVKSLKKSDWLEELMPGRFESPRDT